MNKRREYKENIRIGRCYGIRDDVKIKRFDYFFENMMVYIITV